MSEKPIVVVGAGFGGLALALRLAHRGRRVLVLEQTDAVGGRNRRIRVGDCDFDGGPTLLMMLDPFIKLFRDVGEDFMQRLEVELCDPSYRVFFRDGSRIDGTPNVAQMVRQIEALCGPRDAQRYPELLGALGSLYKDAIPLFVRKNFDGPQDFFTPRQLAAVAKHGMIANLGKRIERYVEDPRLRMLFSFQTMYLGLSPFDAPWVYAVLTYMEYGEGIWYPRGGMPRLSEEIAAMAAERGAEIRLNSPVRKIDGKRVFLASGEVIEADAVVCNADLPYAERELYKKPVAKADKRRHSCSALVLMLQVKGELPQMLHHNVFFGEDFQGNLDDVFHRKVLPQDPAFYACVSKRSDPGRAPEGHENLYLLIPCPNLDRPFTAADQQDLEQKVFRRLCEETGFDPAWVTARQAITPNEWSGLLNLDKGAAFGLSHDFWQSAFFRPNNKRRDLPGSYFVGASTVPGNGLPMVLISAELAEQRLQRDGLL